MAVLGLLLMPLPAHAVVVVLDFEGLQNNEPVLGFYNGGLGGFGSGPGPGFGITFLSNALALIDADAGGGGNFANEPSPSTILFFLSGAGAVMNVPAGFDTGFSFFYTSSLAATVSVYDGLDGTGTLLGSFPLAPTKFPPDCAGDPSGSFCEFVPVGVAFAGIAKSVDFGGVANQVGFDNITLGADVPGGATPAPAPAPLFLLGAGLATLAALRRGRRRT